MPILSIIVATFNAEAQLARTLRSVEAQSVKSRADCEFVLIDGGSSDRTVSLAEKSGLFSSIISEPDDGIYDAMNKGVSVASGDWIQFLNAGDIFFDGDSLMAIVSALQDVSREKWLVAGAKNLKLGVVIPSIPHTWWRHAIGVQPHCHQATFINRVSFNALGGHSQSYGTAGDFDFIMRAGLGLGAPAVLNDIVVGYEGGGVSDTDAMSVSRLLASVRTDRLALVGFPRVVNEAVGALIGRSNQIRIFLGRLRRRINAPSLTRRPRT